MDRGGKQSTKVGLKTFWQDLYTCVETENLEEISRTKFTNILKEANC